MWQMDAAESTLRFGVKHGRQFEGVCTLTAVAACRNDAVCCGTLHEGAGDNFND